MKFHCTGSISSNLFSLFIFSIFIITSLFSISCSLYFHRSSPITFSAILLSLPSTFFIFSVIAFLSTRTLTACFHSLSFPYFSLISSDVFLLYPLFTSLSGFFLYTYILLHQISSIEFNVLFILMYTVLEWQKMWTCHSRQFIKNEWN